MTALRRTALMVALTLTAFLGSAGSSAPAQASFADSASRATAITTTTVAAPTNVTGSATCTARTGTMSATWNASTTPRISKYTVTVFFSDGVVQTAELGPTATSWTAPIDPYYITLYSVYYVVTVHTDYGWSKASAPTAQFRC